MSVEIQWDNPEKTTLRYSITIPWTWNEFWTAFEQSLRMIDEVEGKVDYIFGDTDQASRTLPPGFLTQMGAVVRKRHPRAGLTVFVSKEQSSSRTLWYRLASSVYPALSEKFVFAQTLDEARILLASRRETSSLHSHL
jgi:hypothetical protein